MRVLRGSAIELEYAHEENAVLIDPPEGSAYGFPKPLPANVNVDYQEELNRWLVENGYPQEVIDRYHGRVRCRIIGDDEPG